MRTSKEIVMVEEQLHISDMMDVKGLKEGDLIQVSPLSGKKYEFQLNRTCFDFISPCKKKSVKSMSAKVLGSMANESFHIKLVLEKTIGRLGQRKDRYMIRVVEGAPVKLNGNYVLQAYIEQGDICDIGFNQLKFEPNLAALDFDPQKKLIRNNQRMVSSSLPVLIEGETGSGKTSLALKIHKESGVCGRFVHLNISSYASNLVESELFGHLKGAFTGAMSDKSGSLKEAQGGTLFIDEIDSLGVDVQTKLLLFLDSGGFRPVGSNIEQKVQTRLIFSSGQDLQALVNKKKMRRDFYFRISCGEQISLASLRQNPFLIEKYCQLFSVQNNISISQKLIDFYITLPWPGNYRQLKGHLEKKKVLSASSKFIFDEVDEKLIRQSSDLEQIQSSFDIKSLQSVKLAYVKKAFYQSSCNYTLAASKLGISSRSLRTMIKDEALSA